MHEVKGKEQAGKAAQHSAASQISADQVDNGQHQDTKECAHDTPAERCHAEKPYAQGHDDLAQRRVRGFVGRQAMDKFIGRSGVIDFVEVGAVPEAELGREHIHFVKKRGVIGGVDGHIDIPVCVRRNQFHDRSHITVAGQPQIAGTGRKLPVSPLEHVGHGNRFITGSRGPFRVGRGFVFQRELPVVIAAQIPVEPDRDLVFIHFQLDDIPLVHQVFRLGRVTVPQIPQGKEAVAAGDDQDNDQIHKGKGHFLRGGPGLIGNGSLLRDRSVRLPERVEIEPGYGQSVGRSPQQPEKQPVEKGAHQQEGRGKEQDDKGFPVVILVVVQI